MKKLIKLTVFEFLVQNRVNNLIKYLLAFFLFCTVSTILISNQAEIKRFGIVFSIIYLPLSLIGFSSLVFKEDLGDGGLELLLSTFNPLEIVIAKFLSILISGLLSSTIYLPIIYVIFDLSLVTFINLTITFLLLLFLASTLLVLTAVIQSYFRSNTNFLSILIMPMLMPSIIIAGLILQNDTDTYLATIMLGINLILIPCSLGFSAYLVKNIYNI